MNIIEAAFYLAVLITLVCFFLGAFSAILELINPILSIIFSGKPSKDRVSLKESWKKTRKPFKVAFVFTLAVWLVVALYAILHPNYN